MASAASWSSVKTRPLSKRAAMAVARPGRRHHEPDITLEFGSAGFLVGDDDFGIGGDGDLGVERPAAGCVDHRGRNEAVEFAGHRGRSVTAAIRCCLARQERNSGGVSSVRNTVLIASTSMVSDFGLRSHSGARRAEKIGVARSTSVETPTARPGSASSLARFICTVAPIATARSRMGSRSLRIGWSG